MTGTGKNPTDVVLARLARPRPLPGVYSGNARAVLERGLTVVFKQNWFMVLSGFVEPVLYLFAMGYGVGSMVGGVSGPGGREIPYAAYIAPALLATAAMNGAVFDSTWNVFFKLRFSRLYQAMVTTSLGPFDVAIGEITMALLRGFLYASGFMAVLYLSGIVSGAAPLFMVPAALLVAFGFASFGMGITSFLTTFQQMDLVNFVLLPMFLLSGTLYPIDVYPPALQWAVMALPLWHAVELMRHLSIGMFTPELLGHAAYYVAMVVVGLALTTWRLRRLFLR
ncbi:MAG: ABC transporter permease [Bowdeniella nasicola]|nr:ABC transporter permease [Bowdeniella nasicola]